eukprot:482202-Rhodomonas_salina.3
MVGLFSSTPLISSAAKAKQVVDLLRETGGTLLSSQSLTAGLFCLFPGQRLTAGKPRSSQSRVPRSSD